MLIDCPGYQYQALLANLPPSTTALDVWRDYNGRAGMENVIKELKGGFGLPGFCCQKFFATEAMLSLAVSPTTSTSSFAATSACSARPPFPPLATASSIAPGF